MEFNPTLPIYLQIMNHIKKEIVTGVLAPGERIDSVRTLSEKYGVNLNTMQRAFSELEREQVISTQRGIGSFVTQDTHIISTLKTEMSQTLINEFTRGMKSLGYNPNEIIDLLRKDLEE